jgi:hypothetical protein
MKTLLFAVALTVSGFSMAADAPAPTGLDRLAVFAGTWKSESQTFKTPYSEEGSSSTTLVNQCWKAGAFFVCNQSVNGVSASMLVFTYKDGDTFNEAAIQAATGQANNGTLVISGGVWTFPGVSHKYGQVTYFRVVNIYSDNDHLDFREEYSQDQQTWTPMATGHETRVR